MGDIIDKTQENDELFRQVSLDKHFARCRTGLQTRQNGQKQECADCGEPIPAKRLKANPRATRCVTCQTLAENKGRMDE
jgi:DnaK suppressor protein